MLIVEGNLASSYQLVGRCEEALRMRQDIYSRTLQLYGESYRDTLLEANNIAQILVVLNRHEEAKSLLRKPIRLAQDALGGGDGLALKLRWNYAEALFKNDLATLGDLREAVTMLEEIMRTARRIFGDANPLTRGIAMELRDAQIVLRFRKTPSGSA